MGLADQARQRADAKTDTARREAEDRRKTIGETFRDKVETAIRSFELDSQVVHLGSTAGTYQERRRRDFGGHYLIEVPYELHRVRVDDVVLVQFGWNTVHVEGHCDRCRRPAYHRGYISALEPAKSGDVEKARNTFLDWLGSQVTNAVLCWDCEADLGQHCPTCARSHTTGIPVDWSQVH